jgi:hypothetical protein
MYAQFGTGAAKVAFTAYVAEASLRIRYLMGKALWISVTIVILY